jgi:predicted house-cleaning noncanonical NTP pyrophosphatase (MazG superfamily)
MVIILSKIILYSTGCPKCNVLKKKLSEHNIEFIENNNVEEMANLNFINVPILEVDGVRMGFKEAVDWIGVQ